MSHQPPLERIAVIGRGRLGSAFALAFRVAGIEVSDAADVGLLCVPDTAIAEVAAAAPQRILGHTSGATPASVLPGDGFAVHPLQTFAGGEGPEAFRGVAAAVGGNVPLARHIAEAVGMAPFEIADADRPAYHAAASIASNFLVTLEAAAEETGKGIVTRAQLAPLVRTTVGNWVTKGPDALTGPITRGDQETVTRQREAIAPHLRPMFDAMAERTRTANCQLPTANCTTVRTVEAIRKARRGTVGLVPTMGALHEGHLSLIRRASEDNDTVVVSLFVNPKQFGAGEDLDGYPADERRDVALAEAAGADVVFAPAAEVVYPDGFVTSVEVDGPLTDVLCGAARPGHFKGVTTVVAKLLNMVSPDRAYFGQKDAQQLAVIRQMVRDLDFPVEVIGCPIVRDEDGLALSSRNAYLSSDERRLATALSRAVSTRSREEADSLLRQAGIEPEYCEVFEPDNGPATLAVAARIGRARLIDNQVLEGT